MFFKNQITLGLLLSTISLFSMKLENGKKFKRIDGQIIIIQQTCQEKLGIDGLLKIGKKILDPEIALYYKRCIADSVFDATDKPMPYASELMNQIKRAIQDEQEIPAVAFHALAKKYHGAFYYTNHGYAHSSWLTPLKNDDNH